MSHNPDLSPDQREAIERAARDYYEGWFEGDPERLARCLHPKLAKRNVDQPDRDDSPIDENDWDSMVEGARHGRGTRHRGRQWLQWRSGSRGGTDRSRRASAGHRPNTVR